MRCAFSALCAAFASAVFLARSCARERSVRVRGRERALRRGRSGEVRGERAYLLVGRHVGQRRLRRLDLREDLLEVARVRDWHRRDRVRVGKRWAGHLLHVHVQRQQLGADRLRRHSCC